MSSGGVAIGMAQAHGPLSRTNTAPVFTTRSAANGLSGLSQTMSHTSSSRSSQMSAPSTTFTSSSTTSLPSMTSSTTTTPQTSMPANGGNVIATNNIINQKADASRSLYQICVALRQRLAQVPGFDAHLRDLQEEDDGEDMDPVSSLWRCLRKGFPLLTIYNALQPQPSLELPGIGPNKPQPANVPKKAAYKFVEACLRDGGEMHLDAGECCSLSDLFGDDTTGFVKVTQVINKVLDKAEERGLLLTVETSDELLAETVPGAQRSYRSYVVSELVDTERKYVQDLENLHELKKTIEQKGVIPGDVVHDIFLNINAILDFQRRFLIKIETTNSQPDDQQQWGLPFTNYEESFNIYKPFIANQRKAADIAKRDFAKISQADHPVVIDFNTLDGFLLKPMQRLVKYPLLLKDLRDKTNASDEVKADLTAGIDAANRVLKEANEAVDQELRREAREDLEARVEDWKSHQIDHFGELLLHGHFPVVTGKSDGQKEYTIYLFERILLCCKDANPNKSKDKLMGNQKDKKDKNKNKEPNRNNKLQLKGRIFMTNVTEVLSLAKPSSYSVQIFWKGDPGVENFIIRFSNEESMKKWYAGVDGQRKAHASLAQAGVSPDGPPTDFAWMRDQTASMANPYAQEEEEEDDDGYNMSNTMYSGQGMPRNASSTSLRSRSTTGESSQSLAGIVRGPPPRFPMGLQNPPLSVQTQQMPSPGQRMGDSYFSPVAESPASSRTSTTSQSMYPFPRQGTPQGTWEEHNRYTAPAMPRAPSRGSQTPMDAYGMNGRTPQRPSLPAMASNSSQASLAQQRSRSYSTPDINAQNGIRRLPNGATSSQVPAVPGIPAHLHPAYDAGIPRSQNNSPNGLPMRANTQSPGVQRERLTQQPQYPNGPQYTRSQTMQPITSDSRTMSPPLGSATSGDSDIALPTQLKVKVNCDGNYVTLVVAFNITYQSLIDRIDAKVGRFSNNAIARGTMRLRYRDEDGDFVTIESDDDIQIAFQEWREAQKAQYHAGQLGEIELFCLGVES
ncbi:Pleckstrin homology domain-containing protein [Halenospora varia]|nr:Pleckstrin homology domain-containing protein [Halenospora varia]